MQILIVKTSALGDIVHTFPALNFLKSLTKEDSISIDWIVEKPFAPLVRSHPAIRNVHEIDSKKWRKSPFSKETWAEIAQFRSSLQEKQYDLVFDLQGNTKSGLATFLSRASVKVGFGYLRVPEWPNLLVTNRRFTPPSSQNIREDYLFLLKSIFNEEEPPVADSQISLKISMEEEDLLTEIMAQPSLQQGTKILVCPGSNWENKQLSPETLLTFLKRIEAPLDGRFIIAWGNPKEKEGALKLSSNFPKRSYIVPKLSLPALQNLMGRVDLVIAMDSLPLHLAGTTNTPTFSVFGPSSAKKYKPIGSQHHALQGSCPYNRTFEKRCPILRSCSTGLCMKGLTDDALYAPFLPWWQSIAD
jgi:heptosyltransferase-1